MKKQEYSVVGMMILIVLCLIPFFAYSYNDTIIEIRFGMNVWGSIFEGDGLLSYYQYNHIKSQELASIGGIHTDAMWDFPIYIILGIWDLPLYLIQKKFGVDPLASFWGISYGKSVSLLFLIFSAAYIYKVCKQINIEEELARYAVIIFLTSCMTFSSVYVIGQCDIITLTFILIGTLELIKNNKWKFILWFAIGISMKPFAVFIFIPLLLLIEKNIFKIAAKLMLSLSIMGFSKLLFINHGLLDIEERTAFEQSQLTAMFSNKLPLFNGTIPVIAFLFAALCLYCYLKNMEENECVESYLLISLIAMAIVVISFYAPPYRFIYLAPYFAILITLHKERFMTNIFLETVGMSALLGTHYIVFNWCYDIDKMSGMLLEKLFGRVSPNAVLTLENLAGILAQFSYMGYVLFLVMLLAFCWNNRMGCLLKDKEPCNIKRVMIYRIIVNTLVCYAPIMLFLLNKIIY